MGLANEENTRILLAVWRLGSDEEYMELPLHGWGGKNAAVRQLYPGEGYAVDTYYNKRNGSLTVNLPRTYQARYFEIKHIW